ncbi:MAG: energy transducer TonB [Pseudomonadota bacterium]
MKQVVVCLLAGLAVAGSAGAQQVSEETISKVSNGLEAYYKSHPEMRPENLHIADAAAMAKAKADGLCARPVYPKQSLRAEQQGRVDLEFLIDIDGTVADSRVTKSSGFPALDAAAKEGLGKCRFKPATTEGKPARAWQSVSYIWTLK